MGYSPWGCKEQLNNCATVAGSGSTFTNRAGRACLSPNTKVESSTEMFAEITALSCLPFPHSPLPLLHPVSGGGGYI